MLYTVAAVVKHSLVILPIKTHTELIKANQIKSKLEYTVYFSDRDLTQLPHVSSNCGMELLIKFIYFNSPVVN